MAMLVDFRNTRPCRLLNYCAIPAKKLAGKIDMGKHVIFVAILIGLILGLLGSAGSILTVPALTYIVALLQVHSPLWG